MGEVVSLPTKDERQIIWACNCGSTSHCVHADGGIECANCGVFANGCDAGWRERLPDPPATVPALGGDNFKVVSLGDAENFIRRHAKAGVADAVAILILREDGSASTWSSDCKGNERSAWLRRKLDEAYRRMTAENAS